MASLETILNIRVEGTSQMTKLKDQITQTEAGIKKLKEAQKKAGADGKVFTKTIVEAETKLKAMRGELTRSKTEMIKANAVTGKLDKSYNSLTKQNAALSIQLRKLADPLGKNKKEFQKLSGQIDANTNKLKRMDSAMGRSQRNVGNYGQAMAGMAMKVAGVVMAFKTLERAISVFVDFEFQIKQVGIISGASAEEMKGLSDQAKELGRTTAFTAGEVAGLQKELAKLGFDPTEINNMTSSVLDLAFSFGDDLGQTAEQVGIVLKAFNIDASEASRITDVMAVAFSNTALDLEKFSVGMPKVASIAKTMGFSFEDTTTMLGALANTGMEASTSATALKNIFLKLADPTGDLAKTLGRNITSLDQMIPAMRELEASGIDVAKMLEITDKRSVTAFASLLSGTKDLEDLSEAIQNSEGTTALFAETMRDSLKGSIDETKSAAEGFVLTLVEDLAPVLEIVMSGLKGIFAVLQKLSPLIIGVTTAFVTYKAVMIASRVALWAYQAATVAVRIATIALTYGTRGLTLSMRALNIAIKANPIGLIISIAAGAIAMFASMGDEAEEVSDAMKEMNEEAERMKTLTEGLNKNQAKEIQNVQKLVAVIKDENKGRTARLKAVKELNGIAGTTITNLSNEKKLAKELAGAYKNAVEAIKAKYILQLAEGEVLNLIEKEVKLQNDLEKTLQSQRNIQGMINGLEEKKTNYLKLNNTQTGKNMIQTNLEGEVIENNNVIKEKSNDIQHTINGWSTDLQESKKKEINLINQINGLQTQQNGIMSKAQQIVEKMIVVKTEDDNTTTVRLTKYQKLKQAVADETTELQKLIEKKERGKATDKEVEAQIEKLKQAKIKLMKVDKQVAKIQKDLNDELTETIDPLTKKLEATQKQIDADELMLTNMKTLESEGAKLTKEIINQSIKIAQAKLDMALLTIKASDESTDAEVENINKLKSELAQYQADLKNMSADQPVGGWLNKSLFGTGADGDDGTDYTGRDFINDITETMGGVMGIMDEVSNLQHQRLDSELGVIETEKAAEIAAYKKTAEFAVMSQEDQDTALDAIAKKHDDKMLALKQAQFDRDQQMMLAQALMGGAMAIMQIWSAQATGNAIADVIIKGILTAAQVAMTSIQIATIKAQKPPTAELGGIEGETFADGGMVHGKSHKEGGEKFAVGGRVVELEGGEAVINKRATAMHRPMLSKINSSTGGKKFADGGMVFATDMLETQAIAMENQLLNSDPQEVLLVEADVTQSQKTVANIEAKATF